MYTDSVENESEFLSSLWKSSDWFMPDGGVVSVCPCPKCHTGTVMTRCTHGRDDYGHEFWESDHYCDSCGEVFDKSRISADIFLHRPHRIIERMETPFGNVTVKVNGRPVPFRCRGEEEEGVPVQIIDIDMSSLKKGDIITCGFDEPRLSHCGSDERQVTFTCENKDLVLGFCAFDPEEYRGRFSDHCFELSCMDEKGATYTVMRSPSNYSVHEHHQSVFASIAIAWISKDSYEGYEDAEDKVEWIVSLYIG